MALENRLKAVLDGELDGVERSQNWLAEKADMTAPAVSLIVQGKRDPQISTCVRIVEALREEIPGVTLDYLFLRNGGGAQQDEEGS